MSRDRGSAVVEFVVLVVVVMVPLVYGVAAAARVQSAAYAASQAVREAGRAYVSAGSVARARLDAGAAARLALGDHGLDLPPGALTMSCAGACLSPGSRVTVRIALSVPLPLVPDGLGLPTSVPVRAEHVAPVDVYRSA